MSKIGLILLLCLSLIKADLVNWDYTHTFKLKKDEIAIISVIKKEYENQSKLEGKLTFRWTLFHNELLILLVNYEGHPTQHVLQKVYKRDSISMNLLGDYEQLNQRVILKLQFSNYSKDIATIDALIYDPKKRVEVQFIDPKRKKR
ncbi:MAG TPA: hypothetical protein EYH01_10870 [Campylobacterales bacterium]|nr:hypothetical protein [Campylobacterales bacterium]HIP60915.1 hypothetical protein [Campylobacterales bacterium]